MSEVKKINGMPLKDEFARQKIVELGKTLKELQEKEAAKLYNHCLRGSSGQLGLTFVVSFPSSEAEAFTKETLTEYLSARLEVADDISDAALMSCNGAVCDVSSYTLYQLMGICLYSGTASSPCVSIVYIDSEGGIMNIEFSDDYDITFTDSVSSVGI